VLPPSVPLPSLSLLPPPSQITHNAEGKAVPARLWTSTMRRTIETAQFISTPKITVL
jgi:hypothetical protein